MADHRDNHSSSEPPTRIRPWSSLLVGNYRLIFIVILCGGTANHMRNVASLYQVYELSGSSMQLGLAGFFQALPSIVLGLFGGVLADSMNRKKLIVITHSLNILPGLALWYLTTTGQIQVWHVNTLSVLAGALQTLGGPARQAIVPSLIPQSHLLNAVTLTTLMMQGSQLTAPVIAGFLIDWYGVKASYLTDALLLVPSVLAVSAYPRFGPAPRPAPADQLAQPHRWFRVSLAHPHHSLAICPRLLRYSLWLLSADIADLRQ